jgi:hypothetical protein
MSSPAPRFYYSTDGNDVHGPVTEDVLRQLFADKVISGGSHLCPEGASEWQAVNPKYFEAPPITLSAAPPPPPMAKPAVKTPAQPPPYRPKSDRSPLAHPGHDYWHDPIIQNGLAGFTLFIALVVTIWITSNASPVGGVPHSMAYNAGQFVGRIVGILLIPYLIALAFRRSRRNLVRFIGVAIISLLMMIGSSDIAERVRLAETSRQIQNETDAEAERQIKAKGYYEASPGEAERNLQRIKDQVGAGDSQTARITRDLLQFSSELVEKSKVCATIGATCQFDPTTVMSKEDIANRRVQIQKLYAAQEDVLTLLQNVDGRCRELLSKDNFSEPTINQAIAGFKQAGHFDTLITLWQEQAQLSTDHLSRFDFLASTWGSWTARNGKVIFQDQPTLDSFNILSQNLQKDVKAIGDTQQKFYNKS